MTEFEGQDRDVPLRGTVRGIIAELEPDELPLVDSLDNLDDQEVARQFARGDKAKVLSIGSVELDLVTPVLWIALNEVARRFGEVSADGMLRGVRALIRKVLHRHTEPVRIRLFTQAELVEVRESVLKSCGRLSDKRAKEIADAVVARLALPPEQPPDPGAPGSGDDGGARS